MTAPLAPLVWIDGALASPDEARGRLSPFDHGVLVGDGVFETMKVVDGVPFALRRHLERLARSLDGLRIPMPDEAWLRKGVDEVLAANGPDVGRVRVTVTAGVGPLGSARGEGGHATVVVLAGPGATWEPAAAVAVVPWCRNERSAVAGLKTTSYAENAVALAWAHDQGASEAILGNTVGNLCEGTGSNVFVVVGGRLLTPPLSSGCLAGVTRELLLELGYGEEADVPLAALAQADEAFLASSTRDIQPIATVDGRAVGTAVPGPRAAAAAEEFAALLARDLDP